MISAQMLSRLARGKTATHPASSAGQAFSGSCSLVALRSMRRERCRARSKRVISRVHVAENLNGEMPTPGVNSAQRNRPLRTSPASRTHRHSPFRHAPDLRSESRNANRKFYFDCAPFTDGSGSPWLVACLVEQAEYQSSAGVCFCGENT